MQSKRTRLDRYISQSMGICRRDVHLMVAQGRLIVDGVPASNVSQLIDEFTHVTLDKKTLQQKTPIYIMMNKPMGVVSATKDDKHITVIDILKKEMLTKALTEIDIQRLDIYKLHLVGRLDFNTTGLLLLTNDGRWSRKLTTPEHKIAKRYKVSLANPINESYIKAFAEGMFFPFEGITTRPVKLEIINDHLAIVTLVEGRYHQIKRMFGRFQNPVIALHRMTIGNLMLDIAEREWRELTEREINNI